jgi:phosphate uptake regulator
MVLEFFRGSADSQLEAIEKKIAQMLVASRHTFDAATDALLAGADPAIVGPDIKETDRSVNELERAVRRELVVHVSVHGPRADIPMVLASMSIAKDAERVGDYAKNIWDLANAVGKLSGDDLERLLGSRRKVSDFIAETAQTFTARDQEGAHTLIAAGDRLLDEFDDHVLEQIRSGATASYAVPRALYYRYLKRVTAHLMNILTSLVAPIDQLDYYDEAKADRWM